MGVASAIAPPLKVNGVQNAPELPGIIRRFELADLSRHGGWITRRLAKTYRHIDERRIGGWLTGVVNSSEFQMLYAEHAVALAQTLQVFALDPKPIVQVHFVFVEEGHVPTGAEFYDAYKRWAVSQGLDTIVIQEEMSDVPHDLIKTKLGRLFTRQQVFAKV